MMKRTLSSSKFAVSLFFLKSLRLVAWSVTIFNQPDRSLAKSFSEKEAI